MICSFHDNKLKFTLSAARNQSMTDLRRSSKIYEERSLRGSLTSYALNVCSFIHVDFN